jgi:alpha-beta hydrolase superfamily lysophospholipase
VAAYRTDPLVHGKISTRMFSEWQRAAAENLERAGEITLPFLILAGTADALIDPEGSRELHRRAPTSELQLLEGRFHEPFNDQGNKEVFALIAKWLRK